MREASSALACAGASRALLRWGRSRQCLACRLPLQKAHGEAQVPQARPVALNQPLPQLAHCIKALAHHVQLVFLCCSGSEPSVKHLHVHHAAKCVDALQAGVQISGRKGGWGNV